MSSAALRAGGILRALTDDHPSRYATAPASGGGEARQQSPRDALNQIRPRVTKALAIPSSWMSVVVMSQKHSMP